MAAVTRTAVRVPRSPGPIARPAAAAALTAVVLILGVALSFPSSGVSSLIVRIAEFTLAAGAAYLIDDAAAALTAVSPRTVWRRRAPALVSGAGLLAGTWVGILLVLRWQSSPLPPLGLTSEVLVLCLLAVAFAALLARRGEAEPGSLAAAGTFLVSMTALFAEPILHATIFVPEGGMGSAARQWCWLGVAAITAIIILVASRDPAAVGQRRSVRLGA